jgi:ankyrin repeat protein
VDVNWADEHGQTPLGVAAENGHRAVVELLLEMDEVKVDWEDKFNQTPYTWAICNGHRAVAELLVDAQPEIHIFSKAGVIWPTGIGI